MYIELDLQEKEILETSLRAVFDYKYSGRETCYDVIQLAKKLQLGQSFIDEMWNDYLITYN